MSRKLYEIADAIERVLSEEVDPETGEVTDATVAALDALEMEREAKLLACARYIKGEKLEADSLKASAEPFEAEARKRKARAKVHENRAERLRMYVEGHMDKDEKLSDKHARLAFRPTERVVVAEGAKVESWPEAYRRSEANKTELKRALKAGEPVPSEVALDVRRKLVVS